MEIVCDLFIVICDFKVIMFKIKKIKLTALGVLFVANFLLWSAYFSLRPSDKLRVSFFDVGQGDSSFIETPDHRQILIDGGPDNSVLAKIGRALPFYDRTIDILIITHPDSDHLAGAVEIARNYDMGMILINGKECATKICAEFDKIVKEKNIKVVAARAGQKIDFGNNVKMDILEPSVDSPLRKAVEGETGVASVGAKVAASKQDDNNLSIISLLSFGTDSFLFMGDAEDKEEIDLINSWPNLTADVLKIGHHGSKNSTNQLFLDHIKPKISVISVGAKNRYGHPTAEVLEKLKNIGSKIFRTDSGGDIKIESEGKGIVVK